MTLIVFGHVIGHGIGGGRFNPDGSPSMGALLQPLYSYHVDAFIFISGYYGIKLKWSKFLTLVGQWMFYGAVAVAIVMFLTNNYSLTYLAKNIFPISTCDQWFMAQYLYLMLMAPLLNVGMESLTKKQSALLLIVMYLSSFRLFSCLMVFIYLLGRHLRKYPILILKKHSVWIFLCTLIVFSIFNLACLKMHIYPEKMYQYMSPFLIVAAISLFYSFLRINVKWNGIGFIASGVLAAYLITDHELLRPFFTKTIAEECQYNLFLMFIVSGIVVIGCSMFDSIVMKACKK